MKKPWPLIAISTLALAEAAELRLPVTRDTWVSSVGPERHGNNGGSSRLKFKGIQEFSLVDADCSTLRGRTVTRGTLHLHHADGDILHRVTVSTITAKWEEGAGTNYAAVPGASFEGPGTPDITAVICGNGGSLWGWAEATPPDADGWQQIPVDPRVLQARARETSFGFVVIDDLGNEYTRHGDTIDWRLFPGRFFHSRDQNASVAPYFTITYTDEAPPPAPEPARATGTLPENAPLPAGIDEPGSAIRWPEGLAVTDLFGAPVSRLAAAKNETTWLMLRGTMLGKPAASASGLRTRVFPLGAHGDALGTAGAKLPDVADAWLVEIHVPHAAEPGDTPLQLTVGGGEVPVPFTVWNFALPDRLSFVPQMNAYGLPANERDYYRLAHEHRSCLNCLHYSWKGHVSDGCAPVSGTGGTWDWQAWDKRFGPLLDGSAFADLPRANQPVDAFYLPLNENWPMDHEKYFKGGYWIEDSYEERYWDEFWSASAAFAAHLAERKWNQPLFEFYLNNKVYFKADRGSWGACSAPWIFDEPVNTQDFWALRKFGREFLRSVSAQQNHARFAFRCDISRPEWQRDLLDGICGEEVVGGALRRYRSRIMERQQRYGNLVLMYGSPNHIGTPNIQPAAWCLDAWCLGADGVVPWQTIGTADSWSKPDQTCLFYPTSGKTAPVPSLRLKAFTAGQQLVEYLTLFQQAGRFSREAVTGTTRQVLGLGGTLRKTSEDDAGTLDYATVNAGQLADFRARLGTWLDQHSAARKNLEAPPVRRPSGRWPAEPLPEHPIIR